MEEFVYSLEKIETLYPEEWVALEVVERDKEGQPVLVKLIAHDSDEKNVFQGIKNCSSVMLYYTGEIIPEGQNYIL